MMYHDHYFDSDDANAFLPLLASEPNIIGPRFGNGEAGSDAARVYIGVRASSPLTVPEGAQVTPTEVGIALLGVWA